MKTFFKYKVKHPKYYDNLTPSQTTNAFEQSLITVLPNRGDNRERILVVEAGGTYNQEGCHIHKNKWLILQYKRQSRF